MYIQPTRKNALESLQIPDNYSGTAMRRTQPSAVYPDEESHRGEAPFIAPTTVRDASASPALPYSAEFEEAAPRETTDIPEGVELSSIDATTDDVPTTDTYQAENFDSAGADPTPHQADHAHPAEGASEPERNENARPAGAFFGKHADRSGFFSRFPFLSALLPPKRQHGRGGEDIALILGLLLLLSDSKENDILPFLLILLIA